MGSEKGDVKDKENAVTEQPADTAPKVKKDWFTDWYIDFEKILAVIATIICGYIALTIKNAEPFLTFAERQPWMNDMLHDYIFRDYLEKVTAHVPHMIPFLLMVAMILFIVSFIMDYRKNEHGHVIRNAGMFMASLTGIGYIFVYIGFGFAVPVMNTKAYIFISLVLVGFVIAVINLIFYSARNKAVSKACIGLKIAIAVCVLGCFMGAGTYLVNTLGADYQVCYEANQYLKEQPTEINQDIAYQIGNIKKGNATYHDGVMYYTARGSIWRIDESGIVEEFYTLPEGCGFYYNGIYFYEDYLYVGCTGYNEESKCSVLQVSLTDASVKEICSPAANRLYFGVVDGKLLYAQATEEKYSADIYCIDLNETAEGADAYLYDKSLDTLINLDRQTWTQKYLYCYLDTVFAWPGIEYQYIGENAYFLYDTDYDETDDAHDYGGEYPYSFKGNNTLILDEGTAGFEYLREQVVDFNIFNDTIYYVQESQTGYDFYFCDKDGENITYIASVPVAFEESDYRCKASLVVGEEFMLCEVDAKYFEHEYTYYIDMESGEVRELEIP